MEDISKYAPLGTAFCEGECLRKVIVTDEGPVIVCDGCNRIVIDNREKEL